MKAPFVTAENIRRLLANDGFGDCVGNQHVSIPWLEQLYRALLLAAEYGHLDLAAELIAQGADVRRGSEPLAAAAQNRRIPMIDFLVEAGATVDARDGYWGKTPLMDAAYSHEPEAVAALLRHGADPTAGDNKGQTSLDWAESGRDAYDGIDGLPSKEVAQRYGEVIQLLHAAVGK